MMKGDSITDETVTGISSVVLDQQRECYVYQCVLLWTKMTNKCRRTKCIMRGQTNTTKNFRHEA
jgi:hypothetical protein